MLIKGLLIGIGKIIPGVSGSLIAISFGIYEKLLYSINNFFDDIKQNFKFLFKISLGIIISIMFFSKIINFLLNKYFFITMQLFIGLIIGSFKIKDYKNKKINYKIVLLSIFISIIISSITIKNNININNKFFLLLYYLFIGFVDSITMVFPGISGTAVLMALGAYNKIINCISTLLNFNLLFQNIPIILPFSLGLTIGTLISVKVSYFLLQKHKSLFYSLILGFSISSVGTMIMLTLKSFYTFSDMILGMISFTIGILISKKVNCSISN